MRVCGGVGVWVCKGKEDSCLPCRTKNCIKICITLIRSLFALGREFVGTT